MKKILIFSGAGLDKESGIDTFRDVGGYWEKYNVMDVASVDGWRRNRELVLDFYNQRRKDFLTKKPNLAHKLIANLEKYFEVINVTQNISNLLEKSGCTNVIHLHGELNKSKSTFPGSTETYDCLGDIKIGDKCPKGAQLRPYVCFFGENLNGDDLNKATDAANECDICIIVGTSMQVFPANEIPFLTKEDCEIFYVDPSNGDFYVPEFRKPFFKHIKEPATIGMSKIAEILKSDGK